MLHPWLYIFFNHFTEEVSTANRNEVHTPLSGFLQRGCSATFDHQHSRRLQRASPTCEHLQNRIPRITWLLAPSESSPWDCLQMLGPEYTQIPCTNLQKNLSNCSEKHQVHSESFEAVFSLEKELKAWVPLEILTSQECKLPRNEDLRNEEPVESWYQNTQQTLDWNPLNCCAHTQSTLICLCWSFCGTICCIATEFPSRTRRALL